jgi:hypothetical protein
VTVIGAQPSKTLLKSREAQQGCQHPTNRVTSGIKTRSRCCNGWEATTAAVPDFFSLRPIHLIRPWSMGLMTFFYFAEAAAIAKYGVEKTVGYISTGGGAFLEVLEGKTLPAFEILQKRAGA